MENPIPFAESAGTRTFSLGYLHAKYASLLVAPIQLSADWSFSCVPLVETAADLRNLMTLALYAWLTWTVASVQPWKVVCELWHRLAGELITTIDVARVATVNIDYIVSCCSAVVRGPLEQWTWI